MSVERKHRARRLNCDERRIPPQHGVLDIHSQRPFILRVIFKNVNRR